MGELMNKCYKRSSLRVRLQGITGVGKDTRHQNRLSDKKIVKFASASKNRLRPKLLIILKFLKINLKIYCFQCLA